MKDHLIDRRAFTPKFDEETLKLDDPKASALMRCQSVGLLVVQLQDKLAFCIQCHTMSERAALECSDAPRAESCMRTVAGGKAHEHDILHHRLQRCRKTDNVPLAIGQEGDGKPVGQQAVWYLRQLKGLVVPVGHGSEHSAP